jgi:hypothetical protein
LKKKLRVMVARIASKRSKNPPWLASKVPESLTPALRLMYDSNKSPTRAVEEKIRL